MALTFPRGKPFKFTATEFPEETKENGDFVFGKRTLVPSLVPSKDIYKNFISSENIGKNPTSMRNGQDEQYGVRKVFQYTN